MSAKFDINRFWEEFESCSEYRDFQKVYAEFRDIVLKTEEKKRKQYYQELYQRVEKFQPSAGEELYVWKRDFLEAWELLKFYDTWVYDMANSRENNEKESRRKLLEQILETLKNHQGIMRAGKKDDLILKICVDVFFSYGEPEYGVYLAASMWEMLRRAEESDEECREYYGSQAMECIVKRTADNLRKKNVPADYLRNMLTRIEKKSVQQFVPMLLEQPGWMQGKKGVSKTETAEKGCAGQGNAKRGRPGQDIPVQVQEERKKRKLKRWLPVTLLLILTAAAVFGIVFFFFVNREIMRNMLFPARENGQIQNQQRDESTSSDQTDGQQDALSADPSGTASISPEMLRGMAEEFESRQSVACTVVLSGDLDVGGQQVDALVQMSVISTDSPFVIHRSVNSSTASDGRIEVKNMEIYEEEAADGGYNVYYGSGDGWAKGQESSGKAGLGSEVFKSLADDADQFTVSEYPSGHSGETYYVLTGEIDGAAFAECIPENVSLLYEDTDLTAEEILPEKSTLSGCGLPCSVRINGATRLPESVSIDLTEAVGLQQVSYENTVERYSAEITYVAYDSTGPISVPEEIHSQSSSIVISSEGEE